MKAADTLLRVFVELPRNVATRQLLLRCTTLMAELASVRDDHDSALKLYLRACADAPDRALTWAAAARAALRQSLCVAAGAAGWRRGAHMNTWL